MVSQASCFSDPIFVIGWQAVADEDITAIKRPPVSLGIPELAIILNTGQIVSFACLFAHYFQRIYDL